MSLQIGLLFALLAVMVTLFLTEKLPVDLTAFVGLVILVFGGFLTPAEAFTGFSSSAVITMLSVFMLGAALLETGVAEARLESTRVGLVEAAVAPRSVAAGKTLAQLDFRERYGLLSLAVFVLLVLLVPVFFPF